MNSNELGGREQSGQRIRWTLRLDTAGSEDEMTGERHTQFDRESSKRAAEGLVIQFRVERAAKRVAWFAVATVVVALILSVPGVKPTNRQAHAIRRLPRRGTFNDPAAAS